MLVSQLRLQVSELMEAVYLVHLLVGPSWTHDILEHDGMITDRFLPGTVVPCPYLQRGSRVLVYFVRPSSEPFLPPIPVPLGSSSLDLAPAEGGWVSSQQASSSETGLLRRERQDSSSSEDSSSQDAKRPRLGEQRTASDSTEDRSSPCYSPSSTADNPEVSRRERAMVLKKFKREQRISRRNFQRGVRATWESEIADDKENEQGTGQESLPGQLIDPEVEEEAFENYLFDRMERFDEDAALQLGRFRATLRIVPESLGGPGLVLRQGRTAALWEGLRRVYFGTQELEPAAREQSEVSREQSLAQLRDEIARLEDRAAMQRQEIAELERRAERRRRSADSGRPPLPALREDDDDGDGDPSPPSVAHTNVVPDARSGRLVAFTTVRETPEASPGVETTSDGIGEEVDGSSLVPSTSVIAPLVRKLGLISKRVLRRIMAAKESLVKFGTFVPRNDRQADLSPEAPRWKAGRDLEWFRLNKEGTFDGDWT